MKFVIFLTILNAYLIEILYSISVKKVLLQRHGCNKDSGVMSFEEKKLIVLAHNKFRNQIATQNNQIGPKLPFARNMVQMFYSDSIGEKAQEWANKCLSKNSSNEFRKQPQFKTGETIFIKKFSSGIPEKDWQNVIETWFAEIKDFDVKSIDSYNPEITQTSNFTQMIWAYSYFVGCGFASYTENPEEITHLYVCQYGPVGNIKGAPIYHSSLTPECDCPEGMSCDNLIFPGLCCPRGHCNHNTVDYNGETFKRSLLDIGEIDIEKKLES